MTSSSGGDGLPLPRPDDIHEESKVNLSLIDPPRWGWTAAGGIADLLTPHERARRKASKKAFLKTKRKRDRSEAFPDIVAPRNNPAGLPENTTMSVASSTQSALTEFLRTKGNPASLKPPPPNLATSMKPPPEQQVLMMQQKPAAALDQNAAANGLPKSTEMGSSTEIVDLSVGNSNLETNKRDTMIQDNNKKRSEGPTTANKKTPSGPLRFQALDKDGVLDMFTYHRGREGMELRDEETGDLLCDIEPTDTNYGLDEPKTAASITIKFPLDDDDSMSDQGTRYYKETITWDLADVEMPTPMAFAANVAEEFGLSFPQTLELAETIQSQLRNFVADQCSYAPALPLKDATGQTRDIPSENVHELYGEVTGSSTGGASRPATQKSKGPARIATVVSRVSAADRGVATGKKPSKSKRFSSVEVEYRDEVQKRLRSASTMEIKQKAEPNSLGEEEKGVEGGQKNGTGAVDGQGPRDESAAAKVGVGGPDEQVVPETPKEILDTSTQTRTNEPVESNKIGLAGEIEPRRDKCCHLCRKRRENCGVFACGLESHCFCSNHLRSTGVVTESDSTWALDYCPICSLACSCSLCARRLDQTAIAFKSRSLEQGTAPEGTQFDDLFEFSRSKERIIKMKGPKGRWRSGESRPRVNKVPPSEFPREVSNGLDIDPGTALDYRTCYTENGSFVLDEPVPSATEAESTRTAQAQPPAVSNEQTVEDGSVDFCHVCRKHGDLLCCDFCPRAFHSDCIGSTEFDDQSETPWECPSCIGEKAGQPEDKLDGSKSLALICAAYDKLSDDIPEEDLEQLRLLSIIHEMLLRLMEYDFGYMFRRPVDCKAIPAYKSVVKKAMDLGTIASKLINGRYTSGKRGPLSWDNLVLAVLKDIELVWHNCFLFNYEGSAVYRMAEVQRRKALSIQQLSFEKYLSARVKGELGDYIKSCEQQRLKMARTDSSVARKGRDAVPKSGGPNVQKMRHKITVPPRKYNSRAVAILDPDTGRLVKLYTSVQAAISTVELLLRLNHECEWERFNVDTKTKVRRIIKEGSSNPEYLLFGYRWLFRDDLEKGKVTFQNQSLEPQTAAVSGQEEHDAVNLSDEKERGEDLTGEAIEMVDGGRSFTFRSIEESLSFPGLSDGDTRELRGRLSTLTSGQNYIEICGRKWRRLYLQYKDTPVSSKEKGLSQANIATANDAIASLPHVSIVKEDLVAGTTLIGFQTIEGAYQDWLQTLDSSPVGEVEQKTIEAFKSYYLDGDRNIDGIVWKSTNRQAKPIEAGDNAGTTGEANSENGDGSDSVQKMSHEGAAESHESKEMGSVSAETKSFQPSEPTAQFGSPAKVKLGGTLLANGLISPLVPQRRNGSTR